MTPTHPDDLKATLQRLAAKKDEWAKANMSERIALLQRVLDGSLVVCERWAEEAAKAKGLDASDPRAGEEWLSGPMPFVQNVRMMIDALAAGGEPKPARVRDRAGAEGEPARKIARVFPLDLKHRMILAGTTADVWIQPGKPASQGSALKNPPPGQLCAILGAGNISAIPAMDALYKLFVECQVVVLKMNPLNEEIGPLLETALRSLIDAGIFAVVYGDAQVGAMVVDHPLVDTLHVTGSDATYEAIVYGADREERARRKAADDRQNKRPFTAELGCVTPVLFAPGPYSRRDLAYQARHVAAMLTHNGGFNCDAAQVLVLARDWLQKKTFLEFLRAELKATPPRRNWVPGASDRHAAIRAAHPRAETLSSAREGTLPWVLVPGLKDTADTESFFRHEAFCGALGIVELEDASDPEVFLAKATAFANDRLWGTLSVALIVHPSLFHDHEAAVDRAVADLRYGVVCVNVWPGVAFAIASSTWGAYPGHAPRDIQSGAGVVHNALLFDFPEKTVVRGPFRSSPPPPYFANLEGIRELGRALTFFEAAPTWGGAMAVARAGMKVRVRTAAAQELPVEATA